MSILVILIIAISLSMDAFSLSLAYGTLNLDIKEIIKISLTVCIFHFFMPLLGMLIGNQILNIIPINPALIVFVILNIIGVQMIIESFKEEKKLSKMSFLKILMFSFAVSVDSFSVGIGLKAISEKYLLCAFLFSLSSLIFTYLGLILGKKISTLIGKTSTIIGGVVLIIIGLVYLIK